MRKLILAMAMAFAIILLWPKGPIRDATGASFAPPPPPDTVTTETARAPARQQPDRARNFLAQLDRLRRCQDGTCNYPKTDPRSYEFARGQDLKKALFAFADWLRDQNIKDDQAAASARGFLNSEDGHVQEGALELLATQPTSADNLQAILDKVIDGNDSALIRQALLELERYTAATDRDLIDHTLAEALLTGTPFIAREISLGIEPFIDRQSFSMFLETSRRLPPQSIYRANLENALTLKRTSL